MSIRNATLSDLALLLQDQHARKVDVVSPAIRLRAEGGNLRVEGSQVELTEEGVTVGDGLYRPTVVFDEGIASKLGIPNSYLRTLRDEGRNDLYDANVNGWLHGSAGQFDADGRSFLVRAFRGDNGTGIARAFLSDSYKMIDNLDVLTAALDGVRQTGVDVDIDGCDLSDRRMYVRITAPEISALAPALLAGYRSPFTGETGADNPTVFAGLVISNSEVGNGAFSITPRIVVQVCKNGMTITKDALRAVHLGEKMDEGLIHWAEDTQAKSLQVVMLKARDAVNTFLDTRYMETVLRRMEQESGVKLTGAVDEKVRQVGKKLLFDQSTIDGVLSHFIQAGDITAGGVMHAVTSWAQTVESPDRAADLEAAALPALAAAFAIA